MLINEKKQESNKQKEGERMAKPESREGSRTSAYGGHIYTGVLLSDSISFPIISVAVMDKRIRRRERSAVYRKFADAPKISPRY